MSDVRYSDAEKKLALDLYRKGWGYLKIAQNFGCYESTVRKWVEKAGLKKHPKPDHPKRKRKNAVEHYEGSDITVTGCARKYGVSIKTMARWLRLAGVEARRPKTTFDRKKIISDLKTMSGAATARKHGCSESYVSALRNGKI